jgi:hypothetical protein
VTRARHALAAGLALATLAAWPGEARAYSYHLFSTLVDVEGGARFNTFRLDTGTRRTPAGAAQVGALVDVVVWAPWWLPHRLSVVGGLWPDVQGTWDVPVTGRRPGLNLPSPGPHVLKDLALGWGMSLEARYRWETGSAVVPFLQAGAFARAHKPLGVAPPHLNLGLRAGGGLEYYPLHRVGLFLGLHVQGGALAWPLPHLFPYPESSAEMLTGLRIRLY